MRRYFRRAYAALAPDGIVYLDAYGDEAFKVLKERTPYRGYTYVWHQGSTWPLLAAYAQERKRIKSFLKSWAAQQGARIGDNWGALLSNKKNPDPAIVAAPVVAATVEAISTQSTPEFVCGRAP